MFTPTDEQIEDEALRIGSDLKFAEERLTNTINADAERLRRLEPKALEKIEQRITEADAEREAAADELSDRQSLLKGIEYGVIQFGRYCAEIEALRSLELSPENEKAVAAQVLHFFIENHRSPSPHNASGYAANLQQLAEGKAITPHLAGKIAEVVAMADGVKENILATCKTEKFNLKDIINLMGGEARTPIGGNPGNREFLNLSKYFHHLTAESAK